MLLRTVYSEREKKSVDTLSPGVQQERGKKSRSHPPLISNGAKRVGCLAVYRMPWVLRWRKEEGGERTNPTKPPPPPISFSAFVSLLSTVPFVEVLPTSSIQGIEVTIQKFVSL